MWIKNRNTSKNKQIRNTVLPKGSERLFRQKKHYDNLSQNVGGKG